MDKEKYTTYKVIEENVIFIGWLKNDRLPVFQSDNGDLYTAYNPEVLEAKVGTRGDIVYKANTLGGSHYFEIRGD
jgi:hypothetical protein